MNEIDKVSLETLKRLVRGKMVCGAKTMTVHAHNKVLFEIADYVEKLQNQIIEKIEKDRRKMGADLCYWQDTRKILGLGNVEKETSK